MFETTVITKKIHIYKKKPSSDAEFCVSQISLVHVKTAFISFHFHETKHHFCVTSQTITNQQDGRCKRSNYDT